tara:strand:- start:647 stop:976 length:330 start_codon:yes stop_codon:yes gene_type:complete
MTTYNWVINQMDTKPTEDGLTDVVVVVHWTRTAQQGNINVSSYSTMGCTTPSETDFTAYPDLTFEQVCGWLDAGLDVISIDLGLDGQIENIINPPIIVLPLPWAPTNSI